MKPAETLRTAARSLRNAARTSSKAGRFTLGLVSGRPVHCIVQVSNRCNLSCGFCSFWENPAHRDHGLTTADFATIANKLAAAGSLIVSLEGGEPLLRNDIFDIVESFAQHHHPILFTNGWRVTDDRARRLWDAGLDSIGISVDYADPAVHDAHRGKPGTFEAALRAAEILRATAPSGARQVFLMSVVMHDNHRDLPRLLEVSKALGVGHQVTLLSREGLGRAEGGKSLPPIGTGARLLELKARHPHFISFSHYLEGIDPFLRGETPRRCWAGERFFNIDHLGDVSPCIEKLHLRSGNLVREPWSLVEERLHSHELSHCGDCLTSCRGFVDAMTGFPPRPRSFAELTRDFAKA